jgi:Uracil DNA glycosylase superfamily
LPGTPSHRCAVRSAHESATPPTLIPADWCFTSFRPKLADIGPAGLETRRSELRLWEADGLELYYAPFDHTNQEARVVLVGITPGAYQMRQALAVGAQLAASDLSEDEVLAACKASASFSGPMRNLLVTMLDEVGVAKGLGLASTASLWDSDQQLASFTSTICYPTFVGGQNYSGESPRIDRVPILREFAQRILRADLILTPDALIVPLGKRPTEWVGRLVDSDQINAERCLLGMPHPSPGNAHRARQFAERRASLRQQVATYFPA